MSPRWEQLEQAPPEAEAALLMDAVLTPNRSLSRRAFVRLIGGFALINAGIAAIFVAQGAYPVAGFLALDVALLGLAFWLNYREGRAHERVRVAADRLLVTRQPSRGRAAHFVVNPVWARVHAEPAAVRIVAGGRDVSVGAFLSPPERESFAKALEAAIRRARTER
jgi:uncharacterized membrane protein